MPTQNKTQNLNLNSWLGSDKPKRQDFVDDNNILDSVIGQHITNTIMHMSQSEKDLLNSPFSISIIAGDGNSSCTHTLSFEPKLVLVFAQNEVPIKYDISENYYIYSFAIATQNTYGSTKGASLSGSALTLSQTQSTPQDKIFLNLNKYFEQYVCIAFK